MADYPRSCIYLAPLLEASRIQRATTLWTSARYLLLTRIYPTRVQVPWQGVTIYLSVFMDLKFALERGGRHPPARWLGYY